MKSPTNIINITDKHSISKDSYQWILYTKKVNKGLHGKPAKNPFSISNTYHSNLQQIARVIIEDTIGGMEDLESVLTLLEYREQDFTNHLLKIISGSMNET